MTDRELLEFAAKAAGMTVLPCDEPWPSGAKGWFYNEAGAAGLFYSAGPAPQRWYPLTDDGDALRLAVTLGLRIGSSSFTTLYVDRGSNVFVAEISGSDPLAATRRAIVRAAAEIGKAMP